MCLPRIGLALVVFLAVAIGTKQAFAAAEPAFHGKSLTEWLRNCYELHANEAPLRGRPFIMWAMQVKDVYGLGGSREAISSVQAIGAEAVPTLLRLMRASDGESNDRALAGFAVLKEQARKAIPALLMDSRIADKDLSSRALQALVCLRPPRQPWDSDMTAARFIGRDLLDYAERHGGVFPDRLSDIGAPEDYWDEEVWPLVRYWRPSVPPAPNDLLLAWPAPGAWICVRVNLTAELRRELPKSANRPGQ